nr:hypothetical protein [Thecaphora frezii]
MRPTLLAFTFFLSSLSWGGPVKADSTETTSVEVVGNDAKCTSTYSGDSLEVPTPCSGGGDSSKLRDYSCPDMDRFTLCEYCKRHLGFFYYPKDAQEAKFVRGFYHCNEL